MIWKEDAYSLRDNFGVETETSSRSKAGRAGDEKCLCSDYSLEPIHITDFKA